MLDLAQSAKANVMPCLTYRDATAAIEFLCQAFGFQKKMVVPSDLRFLQNIDASYGPCEPGRG